MKSEADLIDFDPNLTNCGRCAKQTVRLTFGLWKYRAQRDVVIGGNCTGLDVIRSAVDRAYDDLPCPNDNCAEIVLTDNEGNSLICEDDEMHYSDWLENMLVAATIIAIVQDEAES